MQVAGKMKDISITRSEVYGINLTEDVQKLISKVMVH